MTTDVPVVPETTSTTGVPTLIAIDERRVSDLCQLVVKDRHWLQQSFNWPAEVNSEEETCRHIQGNVVLHQQGYTEMFLLLLDHRLVGVLPFNQTEPQNKMAYIGHWIDRDHRGRGLLSHSLQTFVHHYIRSGLVRRFMIECRVASTRGNQVVLRDGFALEGCSRQVKHLNGSYDDQNIYAHIIGHDEALEGA